MNRLDLLGTHAAEIDWSCLESRSLSNCVLLPFVSFSHRFGTKSDGSNPIRPKKGRYARFGWDLLVTATDRPKLDWRLRIGRYEE